MQVVWASISVTSSPSPTALATALPQMGGVEPDGLRGGGLDCMPANLAPGAAANGTCPATNLLCFKAASRTCSKVSHPLPNRLFPSGLCAAGGLQLHRARPPQDGQPAQEPGGVGRRPVAADGQRQVHGTASCRCIAGRTCRQWRACGRTIVVRARQLRACLPRAALSSVLCVHTLYVTPTCHVLV